MWLMKLLHYIKQHTTKSHNGRKIIPEGCRTKLTGESHQTLIKKESLRKRRSN